MSYDTGGGRTRPAALSERVVSKSDCIGRRRLVGGGGKEKRGKFSFGCATTHQKRKGRASPNHDHRKITPPLLDARDSGSGMGKERYI